MAEQVKSGESRYRQVAVDIASKIVEGHYQIGDKIYTRSQVASQYSVSAETARRAIAMLSETGIVDVTKGSGVLISSYENALLFVRRSQDTSSLSELKKKATEKAELLENEARKLKDTVSQLVSQTDQFRFSNPFVPFKLTIESHSPCAGKSLAELCFWHNTKATVVAVRRGESLVLSPGPYELLHPGDMIYFVGEQDCVDRVKSFLGGHKNNDLPTVKEV